MNAITNIVSTTLKIEDYIKKVEENQGTNVNGLVKDKSNEGTLIEVMGKDIMVPSNIHIEENIGEVCSFEIKKTPEDKVELKYISKENRLSSNNNKTSSLQNIWNNKNIPMNKEMMDLITSLQNKDRHTQDEYMTIINNTKKQLEQLFSKVTDEDIIELINKNYNPEKITIELFEKIVSDNKLALANDDTKKIKKEMEQQTNQEIERYAKIFGGKEELKSIINKLKEKNLPVTEHNIMKLRSALNKYDAIKELKDEAVLNVLKKNIELTVEKVYEAKYSSGKLSSKNSAYGNQQGGQSTVISDDTLKELEPQIKSIFKNEKIEINDKTLKAAKTFIKNDMEIDRPSIEKYLYLKDIKNNISTNEVIEDAVNNIIQDKKVDDIPLTHNILKETNSPEKPKRIVADLSIIKDEHLKSLIKKELPINLDNLEKESRVKEITQEVKELPEEQHNKYVTAKRQLEEIRLKMTVESANRLMNNGIRIDTAPLNKIVEGLKKLEQDGLRTELSTVGAMASETNVNKMKDVLSALETAKNTSAHVLGKVMNKVVDFTLKAMNNEGENNNYQSNQLQEMYDKLGTKPRADLGDNIKKTFGQLESILKDLGIETNNENLRAARILAHNEVNLSATNINNIKLLDQKVNMVLNRLHPSIVANMIRDNLSPVDMNIDQVIQYMEDFDELIGEDLTDKIASYIHEMDKDNSLTEKERQGMIGIYRMLHTITKSEGRAVGFLVKKDMKLSLNNLMEAAKYLRKTGGKYTDINVHIDDSFGALEELRYDSESINKQIQEAFEKAGFRMTKGNINVVDSIEEFELAITKDHLIDMKYLENNIKELIRELSPSKLKKVLSSEGLMDKPIEDILAELDKNEDINNLDTKRILDQLNQVKNVSSEAIKFLEKLQMPINLKNLNTINHLLQDNNDLSNKLKRVMNELGELNIEGDITGTISGGLDQLANGEDIKAVYHQLEEELKEIKGKCYELDGTKRININRDLTDIGRILDMNKELESKENYVQIPIMLNGEMTQLNMYYVNDDQTADNSSMKVLLSLNTKNLGVVNAFVQIEDGDIHMNISSTTQKETKYLKQFDNQLRTIVESMGYTISALEYEDQKVETPLTTEEDASPNTVADTKQSNFEISI